MGYTKDQLLARLQELQIDFVRYDHPVVLTVEEQAKYVGHLGGGLSKNLFLKDKKQRFYIVTALAGTTVDLKVLSQRLGVGKGGLRMAPPENLLEMLQVPLGCVTPFALINDSARNVSLLLDQGFKAQKCCFFHPLSNDVTISLTAGDLDKFLHSVGKDPSYVDLEATPKVGKDQPPDLAALVPSCTTVLPDEPNKVAPSIPPVSNATLVNKINANADDGKVIKKSNHVQSVKEKPKGAAHSSNGGTCASADVEKLVDELINRTSKLVLSEITKETIQQHGKQLGAVVSDDIRKQLSSDFASLAMSFKNTAVTEGFHMGAQAGGYVRRCPP